MAVDGDPGLATSPAENLVGAPTPDPWVDAAARAQATGEPVPVGAATTATSTVQANPRGGYTLTQTAMPVRARVNGRWEPLDATLVKQADGSVTTRLTAEPLVLSGGGQKALAVLRAQGQTIRLRSPLDLPAPELSGATATYREVLPGVDLQARADTQGGMRTVFVVRTPQAAADQRVRDITFDIEGTGLRVGTDAAGNISIDRDAGGPLLRASAPVMWDSSTDQAAVSSRRVGAEDRSPLAAPSRERTSSTQGPGASARVTAIAVTAEQRSVHLEPTASLLDEPATTWPVYIDPTWSSVSAKKSGWATITSTYSGVNYWNTTPDPAGKMQVGNPGSINSVTLINFPISPVLKGATINKATLNLFQSRAYSCVASRMNVYAPDQILTSANAKWSSWSGTPLGNVVGSVDAAHGYDSTCPAAAIGLDVAGGVTKALAANRSMQTFYLAPGTTGPNGWKEFEPSTTTTPALTVEFNHPVNAPSGLRTSPESACPSNSATVVGDNDVYLYATVSDPDRDAMTVQFFLKKTSGGQTVLSPTLTGAQGSGTLVQYKIPQATLRTAAGGLPTNFSWYVVAKDAAGTSRSSITCAFVFDASRPGAPDFSAPEGAQIGVPVSVPIVPPSSGSIPVAYMVQVNAGAPVRTDADATGKASITITPTRQYNTMIATPLSIGGNYGTSSASKPFTARLAQRREPHDFTGDGNADLVITGGRNNVPPGLWLAAGTNTGPVSKIARNIGIYGNGTGSTGTSTDFGPEWRTITGAFSDNLGQDVLTYRTPTETEGGGVVIQGTPDGTPLASRSLQNLWTVDRETLRDEAGANPTQLTPIAAQTSLSESTYDDLLGVTSNLIYYKNSQSAGLYEPNTIMAAPPSTPAPSPTGSTSPLQPLAPPVAGTLWQDWTLAATQLDTATGPSTALYLWHKTTGALYLWDGFTIRNEGTAYVASYTTRTIATSGWNTAVELTLQAADIDGDTRADLWTIGSGASVTPYLLTAAFTVTASPTQTLSLTSHEWPTTDYEPGASVTPVDVAHAAKDTAAESALVGTNSGATWTTGSNISPAVSLNGSAALVATPPPPSSTTPTPTLSPALTTGAPFTVSAWVRPDTAGGVLLSQAGSNSAAFKVYMEPSDSSWRAAISNSDVASPVWTTITAGPASVWPGQWTNVTLTYRADGWLNLYLNNVKVATVNKPGLWTASGPLRIGDVRTSSTTFGSNLKGQVAQIRAYTTAIDPAVNETPPSYYKTVNPARLLDTRSGTGGTTGPVAGGKTIRLQLRGVAPIPSSVDVTAVAMTLTSVSPSTDGWLMAYAENTPRPNAALTQYKGGAGNVSDFAIVQLGNNGYVDIYTTGTTQIMVDVIGYFTTNPTTAGSMTYFPSTPETILDTRGDKNGGALGAPIAKINSGSTLAVQVAGKAGVPLGADAALVHLSAADAPAPGYLEAWPDGATPPNSSMLQYPGAFARAITQIVPLASNGKMDLRPSTGPVNLIATVIGYFDITTSGKKFHSLPVARIIDTRTGNPTPPGSAVTVGQGDAVVADDACIVVSVTKPYYSGDTRNGWLALASADGTNYGSGGLNFTGERSYSNTDIVPTGASRGIRTASNATIHLIVDRLGYFSD
ncbi:MAG: LamG-like jellyroll fold domain-containing protein [Kineosporiaceae bacterium]